MKILDLNKTVRGIFCTLGLVFSSNNETHVNLYHVAEESCEYNNRTGPSFSLYKLLQFFE
jgi:hypothetical protein